ncbi:MAG: PAS domain-containing protein [Candidatus Obscuribacterales bacterium]|nr:PAS domain-containing protein [Candidatus Obscuribacterales bacterium]
MENEEAAKPMVNHTLLDAFLNSKERMSILERAVESARNGICITDPSLPDNPIVYVNTAFTEMTGYSLEEILGTNCRFLQGADRNQPELEPLRKALKEGSACVAVLRNYKKDGTLFFNELSIAPVFDKNGKLINFIGVQHDITARKDAERRVSEFYSMVSHELRTPLSSIRASLGLVSDGSAGTIPAPAHRLIQIASQNAERLLKLVDDILDLKKMEAGKLVLELTMIEPEQLVHEVIESLNQLAANSQIKLVKEGCSQTAFCADPSRVSQVLINLVANAIKFSTANSTVKIKTEDTSEGVKFTVTDNGEGINEDDQNKLFLKFQQLDSSDTRQQSGTGLGLAISKTIVELHGGKIGVSSKLGHGSSFWFVLPLVPKITFDSGKT